MTTFLCTKYFELFYLEGKYFQLFAYKNISRRVTWFNKGSYKNKCISRLRFFNLPIWRSVQLVDATRQAGDLFDQVDRERGANRNQSRGTQLIHAERLTHHPNSWYTLPEMDSWYYNITIEALMGGGRQIDPPPPLDFLALNFWSLTDYQTLSHNCSLFVNTSFDIN